MLNLNKLKDIEYLREKERAHIIARRTATPLEQLSINFELSIIYNAKYKLLKKAN